MSAWGQLITHIDVRNPLYCQSYLFKRHFRVSFGLFMDQLIPMCKVRNIFSTKDEVRVRDRLEFKSKLNMSTYLKPKYVCLYRQLLNLNFMFIHIFSMHS